MMHYHNEFVSAVNKRLLMKQGKSYKEACEIEASWEAALVASLESDA